MDQTEAIKKAKQFAQTAFAAESNDIIAEHQEKLRSVLMQASARGTVGSGQLVTETAKVHGEQIKALTQARLNAVLEGYERHGIPIDEKTADTLASEVTELMEKTLAKLTNVAPRGTPKHLESQYPEIVRQHLRISAAWIRTYIDRRRLPTKHERNDQSVQFTIHHAANVNLGTQLGTINAILQSVEEQAGSKEIVKALRELTDAVARDANYKEHKKQDALEVIEAIAKQAETKTQARSNGTIKAMVSGLPHLLSASKDILDLWDRCWPAIKHHFGM